MPSDATCDSAPAARSVYCPRRVMPCRPFVATIRRVDWQATGIAVLSGIASNALLNAPQHFRVLLPRDTRVPV